MWKRVKDQKGFTLVELLVVIAIIGILAAIISPNAFKAVEKGKVAAVEADYKAIKAAALNAYTDTGVWPPTPSTANDDPGLVSSSKWTGGAPTTWNGPYLERWKSKNPWGGNYEWKNDTSGPFSSGNQRYLLLTDVPGVDDGEIQNGTPAKLIETDLGSDVVKGKSGTDYLYILISKDS
ncbi:MAG: type II secretion system protein [Bacillota bacterium]